MNCITEIIFRNSYCSCSVVVIMGCNNYLNIQSYEEYGFNAPKSALVGYYIWALASALAPSGKESPQKNENPVFYLIKKYFS